VVELDAFVNETINLLFPGLPHVRVMFTRGGRTTAGTCRYNTITKECVIRLNGLLWDAMTEEDRFDTVMHEAAHAIEFQRYGTSSHGPRWQLIAKAIGCSGEACVTGEAAQRMSLAYRKKADMPAQGVRPREEWTPGDVFVYQKAPRTKKTIGRITDVNPDYAWFRGIQGTAPMSGKMPYSAMSLPTDADRDVLEQAEAASERERLAMFARSREGTDKPLPGESLKAWLERTGGR
jgi:predicted SprT family Zn-dependent metalloprotease